MVKNVIIVGDIASVSKDGYVLTVNRNHRDDEDNDKVAAMVYGPDDSEASYNYACSFGRMSSDRSEIPRDVLQWLKSLDEWVHEFLGEEDDEESGNFDELVHGFLDEESGDFDDEDFNLTAEQLDSKYNPDGNGQHPYYTRDNWIYYVSNRRTLFGYWEWVKYRLSMDW